jgi:surface protein
MKNNQRKLIALTTGVIVMICGALLVLWLTPPTIATRKRIQEYKEDPEKAEGKYGPIGKWDTSDVTDMSSWFKHAREFDGDISRWDTRRVTTMANMFHGAKAFNGDISRWDTRRVTKMNQMFFSAEAFNRDISRWDTSKITNMESMFFNAKEFDQDIGSWETSRVTTMREMFFNAEAFNEDISGWDTNKVTNMDSMFRGFLESCLVNIFLFYPRKKEHNASDFTRLQNNPSQPPPGG